MSDKPTGLALLRVPFAANHISKLPKPTRAQTELVKADFKKGIRCTICGAWHAPDVVHLDYVGHAALTDRLLDADPMWTWEPLSMADGLPVLDGFGGMWIRLTVCGVTRLGYGHPDDKTGGNAIKETIGDALRNAAMRFGAALDLWHKGDLHADDDDKKDDKKPLTTGVHKPTALAKGEMTAEQHTFVARIAAAVSAKFAAGEDWGGYEEMTSAMYKIEKAGGDYQQFKIALFDVLSPAVRAAIKSMEDAGATK